MNLDLSSSYQLLNEAMGETESHLHPSEAHGLLCGIVCQTHSEQLPFKEWVAGDALSAKADAAISALYQEIKAQFLADAFNLQLYLPDDDDTDLPKRAEALTLWCQGFLVGLKLAGITSQHAEADVKEALQDLAEISKMQYEAVVDNEEDEAAYAELVEYVRMAVMIVHDNYVGTQHDQDDHVC